MNIHITITVTKIPVILSIIAFLKCAENVHKDPHTEIISVQMAKSMFSLMQNPHCTLCLHLGDTIIKS